MERTSVPQRLDRALHRGTGNNDILGDIEDNLAAVKSNVQLKLMMSSIAILDYVSPTAAMSPQRQKLADGSHKNCGCDMDLIEDGIVMFQRK